MINNIEVGAHLVTPRVGYSLHGIYVGEDKVVHYTGLFNGEEYGLAEEVPFSTFTDGLGYYIQGHGNSKFHGAVVAARARLRVGEDLYGVFGDNCEYFCEWCLNNEHDVPGSPRGASVFGAEDFPSSGPVTRAPTAVGDPVAGNSGAESERKKTKREHEAKDSIALGAHLVSSRTGYSHHGIYVGKNRVVHYSGLADGLDSGPVEEVSLSAFRGGSDYFVRHHGNPKFNGAAAAARARSRIGESLYCGFSNNCEHFCNWSIDDDHLSDQVDNFTAGGSGVASGIVGLGARAGISSVGAVAGLSGSGVMSGLATVGSVVGGGAVAGIGLGGLTSGLAAASLINNTVLADNPALGCDERESRAVGRAASYAGAAAGTAGSIAAVSAMGTTAGLSAAGITSGLAAIGGTVGGGMAAGAAVTIAAPVAAAAAVGYGLYKIVKWFKD